MSLIKKAHALAKGRRANLFGGFFVLLLIRLIALCPLAALATKEKAVALLCPLLVVFVVLPLRFSTAQALQGFVKGERFFSASLISFENYGKKLVQSLIQVLKIALYAIPFAALVAYTVHHLKTTDFIRTLSRLTALGGSFDKGLLMYLGFALLLLVPMLIGMGFNCTDRFYLARSQKVPNGARKKYFYSGFVSFLVLLPSAALVIAALLIAALPFIQSLMKDRSGFQTAVMLMIPAACWYVAALPVRKLFTPIAIADET